MLLLWQKKLLRHFCKNFCLRRPRRKKRQYFLSSQIFPCSKQQMSWFLFCIQPYQSKTIYFLYFKYVYINPLFFKQSEQNECPLKLRAWSKQTFFPHSSHS